MTNTYTAKTTDTTPPNTAPQTQPLDAWQMACAVLSGVRKALLAAEAERQVAVEASGGKPFGPGLTRARVIAEAMIDAEKLLEADLGQVARANNLPLPSRNIERN